MLYELDSSSGEVPQWRVSSALYTGTGVPNGLCGNRSVLTQGDQTQ